MKNILLCILMMLLFGTLQGQEICDNGMDDDGDSLIDIQDPDCSCNTPFHVNLSEDFESYSECPTTFGGYLDLITPWRPVGTPQGVNTCGFVGNDFNFPFVPLPMPSGEGAIGMGSNEGMIQCLQCNLVEGETYELRFNAAVFTLEENTDVGFTIYGRTNCNGLDTTTPFDYDFQDDCPTEDGWVPLATAFLSGNLEEWLFYSETFIADNDYSALFFFYECSNSLAYSYIDLLEIEGPFTGDNCPLIPPIPEATTALSGDCISGYTLAVTPTDALQYQWYLDGVAITGATDTIFNIPPAPQAGEYQVAVSYANGRCTISDPLLFTPDLEVLDIEGIVTDAACIDEQFGTIELSINSPNIPFEIQWNSGDTSIVLDGVDPGNYVVTVTDANACFSIQDYTINEYLSRVVSFSTTATSCDWDEYLLQLADSPAADLIYLLNGENIDLFPTGTLNGIAPGNYTFSYQEANGCEVEISAFSLLDQAPYQVFVDETAQILEYGDDLVLSVRVIPEEQLLRDNEITWSTLNPFDCLQPAQDVCAEIQTTVTESEIVRVRFLDELGCEQQFTIPITVSIPNYLYAPNAFSPNGDGLNDRLEFFVTDFVRSIPRIQVYDRWGNLLYQKENLQRGDQFFWDGTRNGKLLSTGVYVYIITLELATGEREIVSGDIMLMR